MTAHNLASLVSLPEALALPLEPDEPVDVVSGSPIATVRELYRDDHVQAGVWQVTPGVFAGANDGFGEHMQILAGEGTVTSEDGSSVEMRPGVTFVARSGWRGQWEVRETIRKVYVIWQTA
jgi:uncharacterized cupin superfamily protein